MYMHNVYIYIYIYIFLTIQDYHEDRWTDTSGAYFVFFDVIPAPDSVVGHRVRWTDAPGTHSVFLNLVLLLMMLWILDDVVDTSDSWAEAAGGYSDLLVQFLLLRVLRGLVVDGEGYPQRNLIF